MISSIFEMYMVFGATLAGIITPVLLHFAIKAKGLKELIGDRNDTA